MKFIDNQLVGQRLEKIRESLKLSARQFAIKAGIDQSHYSKVERAELGITENLTDKISSTYAIDKEYLLYGTGTYVPKVEESEEYEESYLARRRKKKNEKTPFFVPLIPIKAQAGYVKAIDQEVFMEDMELYAIPPGVNPHGAIWRFWEVEGDSMEPALREGDFLLASQVPQMDWGNLRDYYLYIIVTADKVLSKRIFPKRNKKDLVLLSENEEMYPQQLLPIENIKEIWLCRRAITSDIPPTRKFIIKV